MASRAMKIDPKKAVTSEPRRTPAASTQTNETSAIEARAYELWVQRGCPIGSPEVDWYQAEEELRGGTTSVNAA